MPAFSLYDPALYERRYAPHAVFYYDRVWDGYRMETHTHPQVEIMYLVAGRCQVYWTQEGQERRCDLAPGTYILLDTGVPHRLFVQEGQPCRMKNIEFAFTLSTPAQMAMAQLYQGSEDLRNLLKGRSPVLFGADPQGDLLRAFDSLLTFYLYSLEKPHAKTVTDHAFCMLLLTIAYLQGQAGGGQVIYLRRALGYIEAHIGERVTAADTARAAGVHPVYLQRLFKAALGMTMVQYVTSKRVDRAAYLLRHTAKPAAQIAREVGFGSRQQFYRSFVREKGEAPQAYRLRHRG